MTTEIRNFHSSDLFQLYQICLQTGANGEDATGLVEPELLGHLYAAPYAIREPELCYVVTVSGWPMGYILGTANTPEFNRWAEVHWWPDVRRKYPIAGAKDARQRAIIELLHRPAKPVPSYCREYPAQLHMDLLKPVQSGGHGSRLMEKFLTTLSHQNVVGVHLEVSKGNQRAAAWYPRFGFEVIEESKSRLVYGLKL